MAGGTAFAGLHPQLKPYASLALEAAALNKIPVTVTSVYRSMAEQAKLRKNFDDCTRRGLSGLPVSLAPGLLCSWPANKPGQSAHNYGLAWDSVVDPKFQAAWDYIRRWAGWEVLPNDLIHAQLPGWQRYVT